MMVFPGTITCEVLVMTQLSYYERYARKEKSTAILIIFETFLYSMQPRLILSFLSLRTQCAPTFVM